MTEIYLVHTIGLKPHSYDLRPALAFKTKEEAQEFIEQHKGRYGEGYFRWDEILGKEVPCNEDHEDAWYSYGWNYLNSTYAVKLM